MYACGGQSVGEDSVIDASGEWSVQWDTRICSNGQQDLDTWAFRDDGSTLGNATITAQVSNSSPRSPDPGPRRASRRPRRSRWRDEYTLRFSDCFGTLSRSVWCSHQWWEASPRVGTQYVKDGVLHLVRRRSDGYRTSPSRPSRAGRKTSLVPARLLRGTDALDRRAGLGPRLLALLDRPRDQSEVAAAGVPGANLLVG